jgi:hypothetical protein
MRERLTTIAEAIGAVLIVAGVASVSVPAGLIVAGVALITLSWAANR